MERATQPLTVTVEPLPDAAGFSGAVGRFRASASLDRDVVPLGEAVTLRFRVEGTGNLKWIERGPEVVAKGAQGLPAAGEERPAHHGRGHLRLAHVGVRGGARDERHGRSAGALLLVLRPVGRADRHRRDGPARAAGRGRDGGGRRALAPVAAPPRALPLRSELDLHPAGAFAVSGRTLALAAGLTLLLHAGLWGAGRLRGGARRGGGQAASPRSVRAARRDLERAGKEATSKEQAAGLVEKALHEAFGEIPDEDESERARAVRALLDDARFVRYAPQLGDYKDKVEDLAARAAEAVRRWA